jgi:hypothetical protein
MDALYMAEDIPIFPSIPVSSIKKSQFRYINDEQISSQQDFDKVLDLLEHEPHVNIFLFSRRDRGMNIFVLGALQVGVMQSGPTEMNCNCSPLITVGRGSGCRRGRRGGRGEPNVRAAALLR